MKFKPAQPADDQADLTRAIDRLRERLGPRLAANVLQAAARDLQDEAETAGEDGK